jgi:WD40 repeat protein
LLLFDLDRFEWLPAAVTASPTPETIKKMTKADALSALKVIKADETPLYHVTTTMKVADLTPTRGRFIYFFIGDDQGGIEIFKLFDVERRHGTNFRLQRVMRDQLHGGDVTQMSSLTSLDCYATSSRDGTVKFWNWDDWPEPKVVVLRTFTDTAPIIAFSFSNSQKVLTTGNSTRDMYVWSMTTSRKVFHMEQHYSQLSGITEWITTTDERYVLSLTARNVFRLSDPMNYRTVREWPDHASPPYTAQCFDSSRHSLITAVHCPVKWAEDLSALADSLQPVSHSHRIVGCQLAAFSGELVTVDTICGIRVWNVDTGTLSSFSVEPYRENVSEIAAITLDVPGRRLITCNFKSEVALWNHNNGRLMARLALAPLRSLITILRFVTILGRLILVGAGWDRVVCLYHEIQHEHFALYRTYAAHTDDITAVAVHRSGIVSSSANGEIIVWSLDSALPQCQRVLPGGSGIEALESLEPYLFVADSAGIIRVFALQNLAPLLELPAHCLSVRHSLSALAVDRENGVLYTGDTLGYVRKWSITTGERFGLNGQGIARCHPDEITHIVIVGAGARVATVGADMCVRLWDAGRLEYIGLFTETSRWDVGSRETWVGGWPFTLDPEHFANGRAAHAAFTERAHGPVQNASAVSQDPALQRASIDVSQLPLGEMRDIIDDFTADTNSHHLSEADLFALVKKDILHRPPMPPRPLLQMSHRPNELIEDIGEIYRRGDGYEPPPPPKRVLTIRTGGNVRRPRSAFIRKRRGQGMIFIE